MDQQTDPVQPEGGPQPGEEPDRRRFQCPGCRGRGRKTQGGPTRHKQEIAPDVWAVVCGKCAAENAKERIVKTHAALVRVFDLSEGPARTSIGELLQRFPDEVGDVYSGKRREDHKGDFVKADAKAADLLAIARVDDMAPRLEVARRAAESARETLSEASPQVQDALDTLFRQMEYGGEQLRQAQAVVEIVRGATPDKPYPLTRRRRLAFWGASARSTRTIMGLATAFGKLGRGETSPVEAQAALMERIFGEKARAVADALLSVTPTSVAGEDEDGESDDAADKSAVRSGGAEEVVAEERPPTTPSGELAPGQGDPLNQRVPVEGAPQGPEKRAKNRGASARGEGRPDGEGKPRSANHRRRGPSAKGQIAEELDPTVGGGDPVVTETPVAVVDPDSAVVDNSGDPVLEDEEQSGWRAKLNELREGLVAEEGEEKTAATTE